MIKLIDILKEAYINKQGSLVSDADFVVKQTSFFDLMLIDKKNININDYVNFQSNQIKWSNQKVANSIFNQIVELYKGTALEKYNNTVGFTPTKKINRGSNVFDAPSLDLEFMEGIMKFKNNTFESWVLPPLRMESPIDKEEYSLEGRTFPNIPGFTDGPTNVGSGEKAKIIFSDDDAEDKMKYLNINYIPFIHIPLFKTNIKISIKDSNKKSDIIDIFNEVGLEALSYNKQK